MHYNANVQSLEIEWYVNLSNSVQLCPLQGGGGGYSPPASFASAHSIYTQSVTLVSTPIMCAVMVSGNKINVLGHNYTDCECNNCMHDSIYYSYNITIVAIAY